MIPLAASRRLSKSQHACAVYPTAASSNWPRCAIANPRAVAATRVKYRYIIARWGYATHVMAWELFNEVEGTDSARTEAALRDAAEKLLANTVIETYRIEVVS